MIQLYNLYQELNSFYDLENDWDGSGAREIPKSAIDLAKNFLKQIISDSHIVPTGVAARPDGEALIYWRLNGEYIEANFYGERECTVCFSIDGQMEAFEDKKVSKIEKSNTFQEITKKLQSIADANP